MLCKKWWSWEKAAKGMRVLLVDLDNIQITLNGTVTDVKTRNRSKMVDGKPVKGNNVYSVTILCDDGQEIIIKRSEPQYQIILE